MRLQERQLSFFIHLWLESGDIPSWRGRVKDGNGDRSGAFEDEQTLLSFIRERLSNASVELPKRRGDV
jgi:hypothetical protein